MRSGVRSPYAPPFIQKGPLSGGPFFIPPQSFLVILATPRRGYGEKIATWVNLPYSALPRTATAMAARPVYGATRYLGAQKQNNGIDCNFFAIGNRCGFSNRGYGSESAANRPPNGLFPLFDAREGIANREKVAKKLRFLFSRGMDRCNGADSVKDAREIDDDNGTNPAEEDRHFANVAIAFFVASFCTCPFAMLS